MKNLTVSLHKENFIQGKEVFVDDAILIN